MNARAGLRASLASLVVAVFLPRPAVGADVQWVLDDPAALVAQAIGFEQIRVADGAWQGVVAQPGDPYVILPPVRIDADRGKYLCLVLAVDSGTSLQIFFGEKPGEFSEARSCRVRGFSNATKPAPLVVDMTGVPEWKGRIVAVRLDFDGAEKGGRVALAKVGVCETLPTDGAEVLAAEGPEALSPLDHRRSAAWHDTIVGCLVRNGNAGVMTYIKDRFSYGELYTLGRFVVRLEKDGRLIDARRLPRVAVDDLPGGAVARYELEGVKITTEILPLAVGRHTPEHDGAALFTVRTEPRTPVVIDCGGGGIESPFTGGCPMNDSTLSDAKDTATVADGFVTVKSPLHPLRVVIRSSAAPSIETNAKGGQYVRYRFADGNGAIVLAYASDAADAKRIAATDPAAARKKVDDYYAKLLECRVETPVKNLNDAFRAALMTLEYAWNAPFGWVESINHWFALWHMQHTAGVEWIGHADRSRLCNVTHAENLMPDGAVPQFMTYLTKRRDFGGSNQFFCWQVRHYFQFTNDVEFARQLAPVLDRVIAQSYAENDTDHNGLLGWGLQIGNQEDYVATPGDGTTPSIEGINMYRARRELAAALGDAATVARCDAEIGRITSLLRERLWLADLGRFAYWRDPLGIPRLDGQYHTFLYPVIWDLVDAPDAWTTLRHVHDRLQGPSGDVYCSNNFPNHVGGTWGMQSGAAQQPWAAWAFAAAGRRNETWRPLAAVSDWVMDANHRGSWPEVAHEPNPAYFSPPAGLFVAATAETLFGMRVHKPDGRLDIAPSFPDDWPKASIHLPEYTAEYRREGDTLEYVVRSRDELARRVRWSLPICRVTEASVDGKAVEARIEPGVGCLFLVFDVPPCRESRIRIAYEPVVCDVKTPKSVAEGDPIVIEIDGLTIRRIDDRCGVLSEARCEGGRRVAARVRNGLLAPYRAYGRLGQLTFSRRSVFLSCGGDGVQTCWVPVDLTILPRYEAAPAGPLTIDGDAIAAMLLVRNNMAAPLRGDAVLRLARQQAPLSLDIAPRSQTEITAKIPAGYAALLSPGDNQAELVLPGGLVPLTLDASRLYASQKPLQAYAKARHKPIDLPAADLIADTDWPKMRSFKAYPHMPWAGSRPPLEALGDKGDVTAPGLEAVPFRFVPRRFVPISFPIGRPVWTLPLGSRPYRKLYLLVVPFLDNHDMFAPVAQVSVLAENEGVFSRTLHLPGDLDWWSPPAVVGEFATAVKPRPNRFALLPQLAPDQTDWAEGRPPAFPQPEFWATCRAVTIASTVMNVIEMDLGRSTPLKALTVSTLGVQPGLGVVAVAGETSGGIEALKDTPLMPPQDEREPRVVFRLSTVGDLEGWTTEGTAFSVGTVPSLFGTPSLNSLAAAGESATGKAVSPEFTADARVLTFQIHGGNSRSDDGPGTLCVRLVDAKSDEVLHVARPSGTHALQPVRIDLEKWQGRTLRLEIVDENADPSFAWIGIREVTLSPK